MSQHLLPPDAPPSRQFALLRQRRFGPFFATQFLGAANDNLYKFALTVLLTYQLETSWLPPHSAGLVIGALFILPFVLLSATAGQLADRMDKVLLMRRVKDCEIAIMAVAAVGLALQWPALLLLCLVGMGVHSTFFGPAKFAYLPQVLRPAELTGGNGMVEMGTFVAIVVGNGVGGWLVASPWPAHWPVALVCGVLALLGRWAAQGIPLQPVPPPTTPMHWNAWRETRRNLQLAQQDRVVWRALLAISWMWWFGAVFLAEFPMLAKDVLHGDAQVASLLLVVFALGVGAGSLLCERWSHGQVELGLVPWGAAAMTLGALDLWWSLSHLPPPPAAGAWWGVSDFVAQAAHWRVLLDLAVLAAGAGVYSVPLYAMVQQRSPVTHRARIIAANNIMNAWFMVASALLAGAVLAMGATLPQLLGGMGLVNAVWLVVLCLRDPVYGQRAWAWAHRLTRQAGDLR